jgi:hypothetical protein
MKPNEQIIAEAVRLEWEEQTGRLFIVFEVKDPQFKQDIKKNWAHDVEYRLVDKCLVAENQDNKNE